MLFPVQLDDTGAGDTAEDILSEKGGRYQAMGASGLVSLLKKCRSANELALG